MRGRLMRRLIRSRVRLLEFALLAFLGLGGGAPFCKLVGVFFFEKERKLLGARKM